MPLTIEDVVMNLAPDGTPLPIAGAVLKLQPTLIPVFALVSATFREITTPSRTITADGSGNWLLVLPWPSESDPSSVQWSITTPDGFIWSGTVPEGVSSAVTLHDLKQSHGWALASGRTLIPIAIQGPAGPGASGQRFFHTIVEGEESGTFDLVFADESQPDQANGNYGVQMQLGEAEGYAEIRSYPSDRQASGFVARSSGNLNVGDTVEIWITS